MKSDCRLPAVVLASLTALTGTKKYVFQSLLMADPVVSQM